MTEVDMVIYKILLWSVPVLLAVLGFIGALMVHQLINLVKSVNDIKITIREIVIKHDDLKERVEMLEQKIK